MTDLKIYGRQYVDIQNAYFYKSIVAFTLKPSQILKNL